jgi:predicted Fe-Mo cluster-binding NifX family protein
MRIAIATDNGSVAAHFGRCPSYTIVDVEEGKVIGREEIANPGHSPGFLPRFLAEKGVKVIIAGGMGPRAQSHFDDKNIESITGVQGNVDEIIESFLRNELKSGEDLCEHVSGVHHHHQQEPEPGPTEFPQDKFALTGKICITAKGSDLNSQVEEVFGRAAYFIFADLETMAIEAYQNSARDQVQGAGIQSAQLVAEKGARALVAGQVGPNARRVLEAAGIRIIQVGPGTVREILNILKKTDRPV